MKGTTRCSDHGRPVEETEEGEPWFPPTLRQSLPWTSPERRLEREIVKKFVRSGGRTSVEVTDPELRRVFPGSNPAYYLADHPEFIPSVSRLVCESMYRVRITRSRDGLLVVAA
jgi:hypothetical protein